MKKFYHFTNTKNIESILKEGLKPACKVKERAKNWNEKQLGYNPTDYKFAYLFKGDETNLNRTRLNLSQLANMMQEKYSLLEVNVPNKFPLTIDYDQFLILLKINDDTFRTSFLEQPHFNPNKENLTRLDILKNLFKEFDIDFNTDLTKSSVIRYMNKIDKELWNQKNGCYRTKKIIQPKYITHLEDFDKDV